MFLSVSLVVICAGLSPHTANKHKQYLEIISNIINSMVQKLTSFRSRIKSVLRDGFGDMTHEIKYEWSLNDILNSTLSLTYQL